jgi:hypothetical protein
MSIGKIIHCNVLNFKRSKLSIAIIIKSIVNKKLYF